MPAFTEADTRRLERQLGTAGVFHPDGDYGRDSAPLDGAGRAQAERLLFAARLDDTVWQVRKALPWVTELSPPRQAVLYAMAYGMGLGTPGGFGLLSFRCMLKLARSGNYPPAARALLGSRWAGRERMRAGRLARQMESGEWQRRPEDERMSGAGAFQS